MSKEEVYWLSPLGGFDDFGSPYKTEMFDAPTKEGPWANMTRESWLKYGKTTRLGTGLGQRYELQPNGRWLKVEG